MFGGLSGHIEHILVRQHGGTEEFGILALACPSCNWHKGPNMAALDPETGGMELLSTLASRLARTL